MEIYNLKSSYSRIDTFENFLNKKGMIPISLITINDREYVEYIAELDAMAFSYEQQKKIDEIKEKPQTKVIESKELTEAKNTILNTDPFGNHQHSGQTLGEIVSNDMKWVEYALENMSNEYIRKRLQIIVDSMR